MVLEKSRALKYSTQVKLPEEDAKKIMLLKIYFVQENCLVLKDLHIHLNFRACEKCQIL